MIGIKPDETCNVMHLWTLKEAKSKAGSADGGRLPNTARTVGEGKTQKPDVPGLDRSLSHQRCRKTDKTAGSSTKINRGCQVINGKWAVAAGNGDQPADRNNTAKDQIP